MPSKRTQRRFCSDLSKFLGHTHRCTNVYLICCITSVARFLNNPALLLFQISIRLEVNYST